MKQLKTTSFYFACAVIAVMPYWFCFKPTIKKSLIVPATKESSEELIIRRAAERNGCYGDDYLILLAIRRAENGGPGRQFGIMDKRANTLDLQAAWCACSIVKARKRWNDAGRPEGFIQFMGRRYCPPDANPLNKNWVKNVQYWYHRYKGQ